MSNARTIRLADLNPEPITVELGESTFQVATVTRSVQMKLDKAMKALTAVENDDEADNDKAMGALIDCIDVLLVPQGDGPRAKKVLGDAWKADGLTTVQLMGLFDGITDEASSRPT